MTTVARSTRRRIALTRAAAIVAMVAALGACVTFIESSRLPDDDVASTAVAREADTTLPEDSTASEAGPATPAETSVDSVERSDTDDVRPEGSTATIPATTQPPPPATMPSRLFPEARFLWEPVPADAEPDARSAAIVDGLIAQGDVASSLLVEYGIPIYTAGPDTPTVEISCRAEGRGVCGPEQLSPIRMPENAMPNTGSDGALVIVDLVEETTHELWRARRNEDGTWSAQWGSSNDIGGDAITASGGSGSGVSRLGGVVMIDELAAGSIPHALAVASNQTCASTWRAPAWSTDGRSDADDCIEMGSRLRMDPSIDLATLPLTDAERIVGEALQTYGAYVVDSSASALAILFEREQVQPDGGLGPVARSLGFRWDFDSLPGLPWDALVVLAPSDS